MKLKISIVILASMMISFACGYHLVGRAKNLPRDAKTIYVSEFPNQSTRIDAPFFVRRSLIDEWDGKSRLKVVPSIDAADLVLEGEVESCRISPLTKNLADNEKLYIFGIQVSLRLIDRRNQQLISENSGISFRKNCTLEFADLNSSSNQELKKLASDFSSFVLDALLENF